MTLVVDIGSSSVGAALVSVSKGAPPKILFSTRSPVVLQNESERGHSLSSVISALESVMKTVSSERVVAHKSHIIFSSPWYLSKTDITKVDYDAPTLVTHHNIDQLVKEVEKKFVVESSSDDEVVEHRVIRTKLNGYDTSNPYNKKAKSVEVTFYSSTIAKDVLNSVRRIVGKYFHIRNNEMSSFSLAAFSAISAIFPTERDFLIVDIRGEVTDLSLISDGVLTKSLFFPQGKNALINSVSVGSGQSLTAALSLLGTALNGNCESTIPADIIKFTETFKQAWLQSYTKTIQDMSGPVGIMPQTIFLVADSDTEVFFENVLNEIKKDSSLHLLKHLNVSSFVETSSVSSDPFLALESIFVTMI